MTAWLLAWLLQGIALALLAAAGLRAARFNAGTRYVVWCVALGLIAAMGLSTVPAPAAAAAEHAAVASGATGAAPFFYVDAVPASMLAVFVGVWAAVALVKLVRIIPALHAVYELRDRCRPFPRPLEQRLGLWREVKHQGRPTELLVCDDLPGATVLGFHRPCVALPSSLIRALSPEDLDQIILHEYAHVQRRDDWGRLAQALVQAGLWIHPAAAVVGRAMNREREMACDEWVVARTGSAKAFARCLTRAAETRAGAAGAHALMPALFGAKHDLVLRVERLLENARPRRGASRASAALVSSAMLVAAVQLGSVQLVGEIGDLTAPLVSLRAPDHLGPPDAALRLEPRPNAVSNAGPAKIAPGLILATRRIGIGEPAADSSDAVAQKEVAAAHDVTPEPGPVHAANAPDAPSAPNAPTLESRSFNGVYTNVPVESASLQQPGTWRRVGIAAAQIGAGAGKTGAGIGGVFSRASVSLARRF